MVYFDARETDAQAEGSGGRRRQATFRSVARRTRRQTERVPLATKPGEQAHRVYRRSIEQTDAR